MPRLKLIYITLLVTACTSQVVQTDITTQDQRVLQNLAGKAYQNSDWLESEIYYSKLVELFPNEKNYWYRLGNIYANSNSFDAAIIAYREVLALDPDDANARFNLGMTHLKQSTHNFNVLQLNLGADHPLSIQSKKFVDGILELLQIEYE